MSVSRNFTKRANSNVSGIPSSMASRKSKPQMVCSSITPSRLRSDALFLKKVR